MRVTIEGKDAARLVYAMVAAAMGKLHAFYAAYPVARGVAMTAILYDDTGKARGVNVFYRLGKGDESICVHYYVVVDRRFRGRGYGRILVASVEEACRSRVYLATTTSDNVASLRLFSSMCYNVYSLAALVEKLGWDVVYDIIAAACGYEDDIVFVKANGLGLEKVGEIAAKLIETKTWYQVCYRPWKALLSGEKPF